MTCSRQQPETLQPLQTYLLQGLKADVRLGLSGSSGRSDPLSSSGLLYKTSFLHFNGIVTLPTGLTDSDEEIDLQMHE